MKVLLVSHYLLPHSGGIEVLVDREARLLARAGHDVVLLTSDVGSEEAPASTAGVGVPPSGGLAPSGIQSCEGPPEGGTPTAREYPANVRVCRVRAWNGLERRFQVPWPVFSPLLVWRTWRLVRWCDVVHAHGFLYLSSALALLFARLQGKPSLLTEHIGLAWYASRLLRLVQRIAVETAGRLSTRVAGRCIGFHDNVLALLRCLAGPKADIADIQNPLDQTTFRPPSGEERRMARTELGWNDGRPRVLFVGRLILRKGIDLLLQARDDRYDLVFCGRGDPAVLGEIDGKGVSYLPPRPQADLVKLYHAADVLAVPSRCEGNLVLVAQEALACRLPVLLGDDPGLARYRRCAGLHFTALTPDAIRRSLLDVLDRKGEPSAGAVPLEQFFPREDEWLHRLYDMPSPRGILRAGGAGTSPERQRRDRPLAGARGLCPSLPRRVWPLGAPAVIAEVCPMSESASPCPVCASRRWREVRRERDYFRPQSAATYTLAECGCCGLVLQLPPPSVAELQAAYDIPAWPSFRGDWKTRSWSGVKLLRRVTLFRRLWRLRRYARCSDLLEVGCGAGDFLLAAHRSRRHVCGVEYRDELARALRDGLGLDVRSGTLRPGLWPEGSFDAIAYWEVLEHVPEAPAELRLAARFLRPGGVLLLSFPTTAAVHLGKEFGACWAPLELPRHVSFFNRATFARLCARAGLRLLRYETPLLDGLWCFFTSAWRLAKNCRGRGRRAWHFLRLGLRIGLILPGLAVRCASGIGPQAIAVAVKDPRAQRSGWRP